MEFIHRIISFGISEDIKISIANRMKAMNVLYLSMVLILIISIVLVSIIGALPLRLINLIFLGLFVLAYLSFPPYKHLNTSSIIALVLTGLMMLSTYLFIEELSANVMLAFFLLFPILAITLQASRGLWISSGMGITIILMNYIPITESFIPLTPISLVVFILIFIGMITISYFIERLQSRLVQKQVRTAEYYESEIKQKDEFISQLSHKLRTSLSNITLINSLVHDSRMSTSQKELLDTLKTSTSDLINDVNELVEIATPAIIDFKQSILSFSLSDALNGTMAILNSDEDFGADVQVKGGDKLDYNLIGDPSLLRSILINLIRGVDEFSFTSDPVVLSVAIDYESQNLYGLKFSLEFNVEDQAGFRALINSINSAVEQRTSKLTNANHLLALTASILEFSFEGTRPIVHFFQDINKDSTKLLKPEEAIKKVDAALPKSKKRSLSQATLLLVEDNTINQKIVLLSLDGQVKKIDVANNGKEALDMFGTKKYDVILMDIQMPIMDGLTATKKIREIEATSDERVPILAITANALAGDRDNCLAAGVDDYVSKPFQVNDVVKKINVLLNK